MGRDSERAGDAGGTDLDCSRGWPTIQSAIETHHFGTLAATVFAHPTVLSGSQRKSYLLSSRKLNPLDSCHHDSNYWSLETYDEHDYYERDQ